LLKFTSTAFSRLPPGSLCRTARETSGGITLFYAAGPIVNQQCVCAQLLGKSDCVALACSKGGG
jgi:hypothetical protein